MKRTKSLTGSGIVIALAGLALSTAAYAQDSATTRSVSEPRALEQRIQSVISRISGAIADHRRRVDATSQAPDQARTTRGPDFNAQANSRARGGDPDFGFDWTPEDQLVLERQGNAAIEARRPGEPYRRHVRDIAMAGDVKPLEDRGYDAREKRPGIENYDEYGMRPEKRLEMQKRGKMAQIRRGARPDFRTPDADVPGTPRSYGYAKGFNKAAGTAVRVGSKAANAVGYADVFSEAVGGHDLGINEVIVDNTFGQAGTFARGEDPIEHMEQSGQRFVDNLEEAGNGLAQSARDPSRIPKNMEKMANNTVDSAVGTYQAGQDATRSVLIEIERRHNDQAYAKRQDKKALTTAGTVVKNFGKSACKGAARINGFSKKKCK